MKLPEPTAWVHKNDFGHLMFSSSPTVPPWSFPVFTADQLREALQDELQRLFTPLSDEVILDKWMDGRVPVLNFAREIEAMHGVTGEIK